MSLSKTLQSPEVFSMIEGKSIDEIKDLFIEKSSAYYADNPQEGETIQKNLASFGLPSDNKTVKRVQEHLVYHYAEKILPLALTPAQFAEFIETRIDLSEVKDVLADALQKGSVMIAASHFGGVECIVTTLAYLQFPITPVLKFATPNFSEKLRSQAVAYQKSGLFAPITFIEIGKPGEQNALRMMRVLHKNEILFSAFDEETQHSQPVKLFNRILHGGAGIDRLIKLARKNISLFNLFMVRTGKNYKLRFFPIDTQAENFIQHMYNNLQNILEDHFEQWYFLHEHIPFADYTPIM